MATPRSSDPNPQAETQQEFSQVHIRLLDLIKESLTAEPNLKLISSNAVDALQLLLSLQSRISSALQQQNQASSSTSPPQVSNPRNPAKTEAQKLAKTPSIRDQIRNTFTDLLTEEHTKLRQGTSDLRDDLKCMTNMNSTLRDENIHLEAYISGLKEERSSLQIISLELRKGCEDLHGTVKRLEELQQPSSKRRKLGTVDLHQNVFSGLEHWKRYQPPFRVIISFNIIAQTN